MVVKSGNLSRNTVSLQVLGRSGFAFFTLRDQRIAQKPHLLRVEEMQRADRLICFVWVQDGGICCVISCEFDGKRAIKAKFVSQSRPTSCSTYRNNFLQHTTDIFVGNKFITQGEKRETST